jgi:asparagine synthase (glutamine-hydrolysing)
MCGFAGFVGLPEPQLAGEETLARMAAQLAARGPDEAGYWFDARAGVGLAHRRLAVIELGAEGRQPMASASGRSVLAYNGEIYNHRALRRELEAAGLRFSGGSDTEVLLAAIEHWGVDAALRRLVGMFAFAWFDRVDRCLVLARDRFGEKPLYFGWQDQAFLFGSELKALRVHPAWKGGVDRRAVASLARYNYIPGNLSIHPGIAKLRPGTWLRLRPSGSGWKAEEGVYWSAAETARKAQTDGFRGSFEDSVEALDAQLADVVAGAMEADVPLGAFLSGGIDSSTIVALMQKASRRPVQTYTIGFAEKAYDESEEARRVAAHLHSEHQTLQLGTADVLRLIPRLPTLYDEPFADASQLPTALVSAFARQHVTVALSGDGGDEIFGGYNRYLWGCRVSKAIRRLPLCLRRGSQALISRIGPTEWDSAIHRLPFGAKLRHPGEKMHKLAGVLDARDDRELYRRMASFWHLGLPVAGNGGAAEWHPWDEEAWAPGLAFPERMMLADALTYLTDDVLVKVDRAAMGVGLETRAPFLDHRVFEFAWSLPLDFRIRGGETKAVLRQVAYRYLPKSVLDRPKSGFALPLHDYLRGPLRDWAEALLARDRLKGEGYFDPDAVRLTWEQHLSGRFNRQYEIWSVLMFQAWLEQLGR